MTDDTPTQTTDEAKTDRPDHVVVVGAGAIGVSTAYHLADRGVAVTVLDKGYAAGETTGKAAGLVYYQLHEPADVRAMEYSVAFFRELDERASAFTFHETGYLRIGTEAERAVFEHEVAMQREHGADVSVVGPEEIRDLEPALDLEGITVGTYCPDDGHVDPHTYANALLAEAEELGVAYRPKTAVQGFDVVDEAVRAVETDAGRIEADAVVLAAGPWSKKLGRLAGVSLPLKPYRTQALVTGEVDFEIRAVYDAHDQVYFRSESGGLLGGDGTEEVESDPDDYSETADFDFLTEVSAALENRLPVSDVGISNSWAGLSTATPDGFPLVGQPPVTPGEDAVLEGLFVGAGLQGHGVMRSPAVGCALAAAVLGDADAPHYPEYNVERFETDPGDFPIEEMMKIEGKHPDLDG